MKFSSKKHLPVSIAAMLFTVPAFAADAIDQIPEPQPVFEQPAPQAFSWTGAYFGATLGYGWANGDIRDGAGALVTETDPDGIIAGGFAGYNYQFQNGMVLGGEASVDYFGVEDNLAGGGQVEGEYLATIGPRLGYAFDRALFYVEGGYARAGVDVNDGAASSNAELDGYFVGVGADYAVTDNVFAGLKYDYHDFSDEDVNVGGTAYQVDGFDTHTVKARVGFKF